MVEGTNIGLVEFRNVLIRDTSGRVEANNLESRLYYTQLNKIDAFKQDFQNYMAAYGKDLVSYISKTYGNLKSKIKGIGVFHSDTGLAATYTNSHEGDGEEGVPEESRATVFMFNTQIGKLAQKFSNSLKHIYPELTAAIMERYAYDHELVHGYRRTAKERTVFETLAGYYKQLALKSSGKMKKIYQALAKFNAYEAKHIDQYLKDARAKKNKKGSNSEVSNSQIDLEGLLSAILSETTEEKNSSTNETDKESRDEGEQTESSKEEAHGSSSE